MKSALKACLLILVAFLSSSAFLSLSAIAQENYKDGYIVRSDRDTVRGQIDFRDWLVNPAKISFLNSQTGKSESYQAEDLSAFSVNGDVYRSFKVHINPFSLDPVVTTSDSWNGDAYDSTVFLRLIIGGKLSLYYYKDHRDLTYFFVQGQGAVQGEGGVPEQLRIRNQVIDKDGQRMVMKDEFYRGQLAVRLADCGKMTDRLGSLAYTESALRKLIFNYNNCGKDTAEQLVREDSHHRSVSFSPLLGYFHSSFRLKGALTAARMSWPSYSGLTGGVGMQVLLPRQRGQFALITDLIFSHFSSRSSTYYVNNFYSETGVLDYNMLKLDIQFRYLYPTGGVRPFLNLGFSNSMIINNKSYQNEHNTALSEDEHDPPFGISGAMNSYQIGFIGGAGVLAGRLSVEARFERTTGLVDVASGSSPIVSWNLLVGFRL